MAQPYVLIADDEPLILAALSAFLREQPWIVETVSDGREALKRLATGKFDVAVLDIRMPYVDGFGVLSALSAKRINADVLMLTAFGSVPRAVEAIHMGAKDFLQKPIKKNEFITKVGSLIQARQPVTPHILADRLEAYIIANLTSKDLKLQVLVEHFGLSRSYISKLFKGAGSSFSERVAFHRTQKAKNLLLQTREPIYVVAELCGFKKQSWLSEAFLRVAGQSPSRFRQLHRPEEEDW